jgi:hypothetical protein
MRDYSAWGTSKDWRRGLAEPNLAGRSGWGLAGSWRRGRVVLETTYAKVRGGSGIVSW